MTGKGWGSVILSNGHWEGTGMENNVGGGAFVLKLLYEQPYMITLQVKEWIKINGIIL